MKINISNMVKHGLCQGCGACYALCPQEAIALQRENEGGIYCPDVDDSLCNNCGLCLRVCPSKGVDSNLHAQGIPNRLIGNHLRCYAGYSTDDNIRYRAASGGLITGLLKFAIEEGSIGAALITRFKLDDPLEPEPHIARTVEEIIESRGSKYCPVCVNKCLGEILDDDSGERFAMVGLPCHIRGLRKAEVIQQGLREKIGYRFGLFCHHGVSFRGTEFLLKKFGLPKEKVKRFQYRGDGWPGGIKIELKDSSVYGILHYIAWNSVFALYFFTPPSCMFCSDAMAEVADLSFGDAWLPEFGQDTLGTSIVISRTPGGEELLQRALAAGAIHLEPLGLDRVIASQHSVLYFKKRGLSARRILASRRNAILPQDTASLIDADLLDIILAALFMNFNNSLSYSHFGEMMLKLLPLKVLRLYGLVMYKLFFNRRPLS